MTEYFKVKLEDEVTGNAYRMAKAYVDVSVAAQQVAAAVRGTDKEMKKLAAEQLRFHRTQLMAARAAQTAGNAIGKLGPKYQAAAAGATKADRQTLKFSYTLNALAQSAVSASFSIAGKMANSLVDGAKGLFHYADLATRAHQSFAVFFGGQEKGDAVLRTSIDLAKKFGFTIEDTVTQMQRFGAGGFDAEQSLGLLRFGADIKGLGRTAQDVKGIFLAITQISGKGKLQGEELTQQLAERGINAGEVWKTIGKNIGRTVEQVQKLQKAGKISPAVAINALVETTEKRLGSKKIGSVGERIANETVGGLKGRMATQIDEAIFFAVDKASPALVKGMQAIMKGLGMTESLSFEEGLTRMLTKVGEFMEKVGPKLPAIADNFAKAFGATANINVGGLDGFIDSLPSLATSLGQVSGHLVTIMSTLAAIATNPLVLKAIGGAATVATAMSRPVETLKQLPGVRAGKWLSEMFVEGTDAMAGVGQNVTEGLAGGIAAGAPSVGRAAGDVAQGAIDASSSTLQEKSPSRKFYDQGNHIAQGLALGVDENADLAMHSTRMMADSAIAGAAGAESRAGGASKIGGAAGASVSSRSTGARLRIGDINLGGGGAEGMSQAEMIREYIESEVLAFFERQAEGSGA